MTSKEPRSLEILIKQAMLMQEIDRRAKNNVMVEGWLDDLLPEEWEAFRNWLTEVVEGVVNAFETCPGCGQIDQG